MELCIDYREHQIKNYFSDSSYSDYVNIENLTIGDIVFKFNGHIVLLIERKTMEDLGSSIRDGRHREQKYRIKKSGLSNENIIFLIEGELKDLKYSSIDKNTLQSSIINTMFRDGYKVYRTKDCNESISFIERVLQKTINSDDKILGSLLVPYKKTIEETQMDTTQDTVPLIPNDNDSNNTDNEYLSTLKIKKKKECLTPIVFNKLVFLQIPGISSNYIDAIFKEYGSIKSLIEKYIEMNNEGLPHAQKENLLSDITIELKNGNSRRIGKVISKRVYEYFNI